MPPPYILFPLTWVYFLITTYFLELINELHIGIVCVSEITCKLYATLALRPRTMPGTEFSAQKTFLNEWKIGNICEVS